MQLSSTPVHRLLCDASVPGLTPTTSQQPKEQALAISRGIRRHPEANVPPTARVSHGKWSKLRVVDLAPSSAEDLVPRAPELVLGSGESRALSLPTFH